MNAGKILLIESSGSICSVGLLDIFDEQLKEERGSRTLSHAEELAVMVARLMQDQKEGFKALAAVAISGGPGSYTGLRIGTSFAKGICFATGIPLISVNALSGLLQQAKKMDQESMYEYHIACMDARRMEVYMQVQKKGEEEPREIMPHIIGEDAAEWRGNKVLVIGDAVNKWRESFIEHKESLFIERLPLVSDWAEMALEKFRSKKFESIAYFEPLYIKNFVPGTPKKFQL